jgi:hypothetical protein
MLEALGLNVVLARLASLMPRQLHAQASVTAKTVITSFSKTAVSLFPLELEGAFWRCSQKRLTVRSEG